jgi:hypothetical protein
VNPGPSHPEILSVGSDATRHGLGVRPGPGIGACVLLVLWLCLSVPAAASVAVELVIPPAATHVIGDHTPLYWRFTNLDSEPVAFMWEGCCRLNGRLEVTAPGKRITPVPPGQALAHMFAKAEILQPNRPADFDTRISDWVQLHESGTYQLEGRYTGVLPEQSPQVPAELPLWRDSARTPPIELTVLSVADYLAERPQRSAQRQIQLELAGPTRLEPLQPSPLQLTIRNTADTPQRIVWPHELQLWIVDPHGQRLGFLPLPVDGAYEEIVITPGTALERLVSFDYTRLEGEPFASYLVFIDLQPATDRPRVPSNPLDIRWHLDGDDVERLLLQAAQGPRIGLRNPSLKLLRVYLAELGPHFASLDFASAPPPARDLVDQLHLASCLKPFAPDPGRVELTLWIPATQPARLINPMIGVCAALIPSTARVFPQTTLETILGVRRHLGWELALDVQPDPDTPLETILLALGPFHRFTTELATLPRALIHDDTTNAPSAITFRSRPIPASHLLRLTKSGTAVRCELARKPTPLLPLPQATIFRPDEIPDAPFRPVGDRADLENLLDATLTPPQTLVLADPTLTWSELLDALDPFLARRLSLTVIAWPFTSPVDRGRDALSSWVALPLSGG